MLALKLYAKTSLDELTASEVPRPRPGHGQVLIRLVAAALNHGDLRMFDWEPDRPFILGMDGAGIVESLGPGAEGITPGAEMVINPALAWGGREDAFGPDFSILGWPDDGTFAEFVIVPAENVTPKPAHLTFEEAAALPLAGLTAYRAVNARARVLPNERVLIHGIGGGVAHFALKFAKVSGTQVMVTSTSDQKLERALVLGADVAVNSRTTDWQEAALRWTDGGGPDVIVDSVGGELFAQSLQVLRRGGRLVTYGRTADRFATVDLPTIFWHQLTILGTTMGSPSDFGNMLETVATHQIRPIIDSVWSLREGRSALQRLAQGAQFGKIVLLCRDPLGESGNAPSANHLR